MTGRERLIGIGLGLAAGLAIVILFVFLGSEETIDDPALSEQEPRSAPPPVERIVVREGEPVDGVRELTYSVGERIRLAVESDAAEEVHVHGYDLVRQVEAGGTASFDFPAILEGIFEVELEGSHTQIAELRVEPE